MNVAEIKKAIRESNLTAAELGDIFETIKYVRDRIGRETICEISIGSKVKWHGKNADQSGVVIKINRTRVHVKENDTGLVWTIPGSMLEVV